MFDTNTSIGKLQKLGVGRRRLDDELFGSDRAPARLGICDEDEDSCFHAGGGRYSCARCRRVLPAPHLLHLHLLETHDSFFAVSAARQPSYCCYVQECPDKFTDAEERLEHCVRVHKLPKDFRFDIKPDGVGKSKKNKSRVTSPSMDVDGAPTTASASASCPDAPKFFFHNSKRKGLVKYSGKTFTSDNGERSSRSTDVDAIMLDLKQNLPN